MPDCQDSPSAQQHCNHQEHSAGNGSPHRMGIQKYCIIKKFVVSYHTMIEALQARSILKWEMASNANKAEIDY